MRSLTGAPYQSYKHDDKDAEVLWQLISTHSKDDDFMTAGTEGID